MKAFYSNETLVQMNEKELQLLQAGAKAQASEASAMRRSASTPDAEEIWTIIESDYQKLVADIDEILNSMPF